MELIEKLPKDLPWWVYVIAFFFLGGGAKRAFNGGVSIWKGHAEAERQQIKEAVADKETIISQLQADVAAIRAELKELRGQLRAAEEKESATARKLRILEEAHAKVRRIFIEKGGGESQLPPWPKY